MRNRRACRWRLRCDLRNLRPLWVGVKKSSHAGLGMGPRPDKHAVQGLLWGCRVTLSQEVMNTEEEENDAREWQAEGVIQALREKGC